MLGKTLLRLSALSWLGAGAAAQAPPAPAGPAPIPFGIGERLTYSVRGPVGTSGRAVLSLTGPVEMGGTSTILATFSTRVRIAFMHGYTEGRSWIDPLRMASLRYVETEHRPLSNKRDSVDMNPALLTWSGARGDSGVSATDRPLDELSFIYFLRTMSIATDTVYTFDRFYDQRRTPTTVHVGKLDTLRTLLGNIEVVRMEMHVKDVAARGVKVINVWISTDACRLPVRFESSVPPFGKGSLTLDSAVTPNCSAPRVP